MRHLIFNDVTIPFVRLLDNFTIPVLIFNGNNDWLVNNEGLFNFLNDLIWSGQEEYRRARFTDIHSDGKLVGSFKRAKNLFHVKVYNAGHFVYQDQPEFSLDLLSRLLYS